MRPVKQRLIHYFSLQEMIWKGSPYLFQFMKNEVYILKAVTRNVNKYFS